MATQHNSAVWAVPYTCAQPYHPGSGAATKLKALESRMWQPPLLTPEPSVFWPRSPLAIRKKRRALRSKVENLAMDSCFVLVRTSSALPGYRGGGGEKVGFFFFFFFLQIFISCHYSKTMQQYNTITTIQVKQRR